MVLVHVPHLDNVIFVTFGIAASWTLVHFFIMTSWARKKPRPVKFQKASKFRPERTPKQLDTIVIGSGIGASTCANLLAQSGQKVIVLEQHSVTGGCSHSFRQEDCEFDTGLHYVPKDMSLKTARSGAIMDFMTGGAQKWTSFPEDDPYDEILFPKCPMVKKGAPNHYSYPFFSGIQRAVDEIIKRIDPKDEKLQIRAMRYFSICTDINKGFTALGISRILPDCLQFLVKHRVEKLMKYASMTVSDVQHAILSLGYTQEELLQKGCPVSPPKPDPDRSIRRLKAVLTHPIGDYAVQPKEASMAAHGVTMAHYMDGGAYTVGPTQNISVHLTSTLRSYGGEVFVDATVRSIIIESGRAVGVRVCNTSALEQYNREPEEISEPICTEIRAKNVVCGTSIYNLYSTFLPRDLQVVQNFFDPKKRTACQSNGHVFLFVKIKGDADELKLPKHNLWYFNSYNMDLAFEEYFSNPTEKRPPTVYIGFPCTKDVTWKNRFPGTSNCILISDGLYEWFEKWSDKPVQHRGKDYEDLKGKLTCHLLDILYEQVPSVKGKVEFYELGTPLTEITYLASFKGGSYGTKCTTDMFDPINRKWTTTPHTDIPSLYLAGSDAFLPSITGAMYGGCLGASAVLGHLRTICLVHKLLNHVAIQLQKENPSMTYIKAYCEAIRRLMK